VRGHRDLRLVAWGAPLCAIAALVAPWAAISLVFAAPLALVMPGYAIVAAAFARRQLKWPRAAVLSVALSLCILALGGLVLNYVPGGIGSTSWALLLLLVVLNGCRVAALRRPSRATVHRRPRPRPGGAKLGLALASLVAFAAALVLASSTLPAPDAVGYTELWIVPKPETSRGEAEIGVKSEERQATDFDLGIRIGAHQVVRRSFILQPGEETVVTVGPPIAPAGSTVPVVATLLLDQDPSHVYRRVMGSLVTPGASR